MNSLNKFTVAYLFCLVLIVCGTILILKGEHWSGSFLIIFGLCSVPGKEK